MSKFLETIGKSRDKHNIFRDEKQTFQTVKISSPPWNFVGDRLPVSDCVELIQIE